MQFVSSTGNRLLLKLISSCIKFVELGITTNVLDAGDKRVLRLRQRVFVSAFIAMIPSMYEEAIDLILMLSSIISRTDIKTMEF